MTLELNGLSKSFNGQVAVDDINLKSSCRQHVRIPLEATGAGKTTTFRMILGLASAFSRQHHLQRQENQL